LGFVDADGQAAVAAAPMDDGNAAPAGNEGGEGREKRSRDRYGRERGPRQDRGERNERDQAPAEQAELSHVEATATEAAPQAVAAPAAAPVAAVKAAPAPAGAGMPKVTAYALPLQSLQEVAQGSGLQWVNSDPERVATVQAAIAAEPVAVHVPRERPAPVALDDRPLVLVETKRDLRNMTLPFEQETAA
jgi:ribonuclease E